MGWNGFIVAALLWTVLRYAESKVEVSRERGVTTRGKIIEVSCTAVDEDLVGWFDKKGNQVTSTNSFESKYYIEHVKGNPRKQRFFVMDVKVADGGNYTCRGSKSVAHFELYVEFYVVTFPSSFTMNVGQSAVIPCQGIGYPMPINRWYTVKNTQGLNRKWQELDSSQDRYQKLPNGSLFIRDVKVEDASNYTCRIIQFEGWETAARELRKHIQIIVYGPPILDDKVSTSSALYSYKGNPKKIHILCRWWGFPIPYMNFTKPNGQLLGGTTTTEFRTINGYATTMEDKDFGKYVCFASNKLGTRRHTIYVKEADGPQSPTNVTYSTHCGYVTVVWNPPDFNGGLPITLYDLELMRDGKRVDDATAGSTKRRFTFNGGNILANTLYTVRIRGHNNAKEGTWTSRHLTSDFCPPRGAVTITNTQTILNSTSFTLTWTGPHDNGGDPNITYVIEYSKQDDGGGYVQWTTVKDIRGKEYNVSGIFGENKYKFRVVAVNKMGQSDPGEKVFLVAATPTKKRKPKPDEELVYDFKVNCTSIVIQVDITINYFPNVDVESFRLRDSSCTPVKKSSSHVILRTRLDGCGTTNQHRNMSVTYYNSVTARVVQSQSKMHIVEFPFSCSFVKMRTIGTPSFQPRKRVSVVEEGFGNFSFEMNLYKSPHYKTPFDVSEYPVGVPVTKNLFAQTTLLSTDKNLEALAYTCTATPSVNPNDDLQYSFIENGCTIDSTVKFKPIPGVKQQFQMLPFKFRNTSKSVVYLHCRVMVCHKDDIESRCRKGCIPNARGTRDAEKSHRSSIHRVTLGPVRVLVQGKKGSLHTEADRTSLSIGILLAAIFGTIVASIVLFTVLLYFLRHAIVSQQQNILIKDPTEADHLEMQSAS